MELVKISKPRDNLGCLGFSIFEVKGNPVIYFDFYLMRKNLSFYWRFLFTRIYINLFFIKIDNPRFALIWRFRGFDKKFHAKWYGNKYLSLTEE